MSSESGKTVRKTGKVPVKNGTCQWTDTFSESIWISGSKEVEEYLFKFVLAAVRDFDIIWSLWCVLN